MKVIPKGFSSFMLAARFVWSMFATTTFTALTVWWWVDSIKSGGIFTPIFYAFPLGLMAMALASLLWPRTFDQRFSASTKRKTDHVAMDASIAFRGLDNPVLVGATSSPLSVYPRRVECPPAANNRRWISWADKKYLSSSRNSPA